MISLTKTLILGMNFKEEIDKRGLKIKWVAEVIDCNYASLKVYLSDLSKMPEWVSDKLKDLFH